jgi:hypothetical protein
MLGPLPGRARVEEGIAEGWISPGSGAPLGAVQRRQGRRRVVDVLGQDRGE